MNGPAPQSAARGRNVQRSKNGCAQCKRRKVKCDETRPSCRKCLAHGVECVYPPAGEPDSQTPSTSTSDNAQLRQQLEFQASQHKICLRLLHHHNTSTSLTLSDSQHLQHLMQTAIVELGLEHEFLLYHIYALASLHKSHQLGQQGTSDEVTWYRELAVSYHEKALHKLLHPGVGLEPAVRENSSAVFAFSALISVYSFASTNVNQPATEVNTSVLTDWMLVMRGVTNIIATQGAIESIKSGPIAAFFAGHEQPQTWSLPEAIDQVLNNVKMCWDGAHEDNSTCYEEAFDLLKLTYYKAAEAVRRRESGLLASEIGVVFSWPAQISASFVGLLTALDPSALVILAHFLVLLRHLDHLHWWIEGRPVFLLRIVEMSLPRTSFWSDQIRWPLEQIMMDA